MVAQQIIFFGFVCILLGFQLRMFSQTKQTKFGVVFVVTLFSLLAFYLLYFGSLDTFTVKGLSAEATFVQKKRQQVEQDVEAISGLRHEYQVIFDRLSSKQSELENRLGITAAQLTSSQSCWTTNIILSANETGVLTRAWGYMPHIVLTGSATLAADLDTWNAGDNISIHMGVTAGPYTLTFLTNNFITPIGLRFKTNDITGILWHRYGGQNALEGAFLK